MNLAETFAQLEDEEQPISHLLLTNLNGLSNVDNAEIEKHWSNISAERRLKIIKELTTIAEDNVEFDFKTILHVALNDEDPGNRVGAIEALWEDESRNLLTRLLKLLETDPAEEVRSAAALALGRFAYGTETGSLTQRWKEQIKGALIACTYNEEEEVEVRRRAVEAVGYFSEDDEVSDIIEEAYRSEDLKLRASAICAMGHNIDERWEPIILQEMESIEPAIRYEATHAAGESGSRKTLPLLEARIRYEDDTDIQLMAIWSIGQIGGGGAQRLLRALTKQGNQVLREAAQEALEEADFNEEPLNMKLKIRPGHSNKDYTEQQKN